MLPSQFDKREGNCSSAVVKKKITQILETVVNVNVFLHVQSDKIQNSLFLVSVLLPRSDIMLMSKLKSEERHPTI